MSDRDTPQPRTLHQQVDATTNVESSLPEENDPAAETVGTGSAIALGCVLVFVLTGRVPFVRESQSATLWAHLADPPPRLEGELAAFDAVVARAMAKEPADRFGSAGELAAAAREAAGGGWSGPATVASARPPSRSPMPTGRRRVGRSGLAAAGAAGLLAVGAAVC